MMQGASPSFAVFKDSLLGRLAHPSHLRLGRRLNCFLIFDATIIST
jgi:hypothetical protein